MTDRGEPALVNSPPAKNTLRARARECVKGRRRASLSLPRVEGLARRFSPRFAKSPPAKNHPPWVWAYVGVRVRMRKRAEKGPPLPSTLARSRAPLFPPRGACKGARRSLQRASPPTHPPLSFTRTFRRHRSSGVDPPPPASGSSSCPLPNWKGRGNAAFP